jgi:hypothetical protein
VIQDCFTKWIEVVAIPNKTARVVAAAFADTWVTRYRPDCFTRTIINGSEFTAKVFVELCHLSVVLLPGRIILSQMDDEWSEPTILSRPS